MKENEASGTAVMVALARAQHQLMDDKPLVFEDPISLLFKEKLKDSAIYEAMANLPETFTSKLRSVLVSRRRYMEDLLLESHKNGVDQYVILGAGYDSFSLRQPEWLRGLKIFELDFPATQESKMELIKSCGLKTPDNLTFCPIDFQKDTLREVLEKANFDFSKPAYFSWLGVTQYISLEANLSTLEFVQSLAPKTAITFSFVPEYNSLSDADLKGLLTFVELAEQSGEPFITMFMPEELKTMLNKLGFSSSFHLSPELSQERYFKGRTDTLKAEAAEQVMTAFV